SILRIEVEVRRDELTGAVGLESELKRARVASEDRVNGLDPRSDEVAPGNAARIERDGDGVGDALTDVVHGDEQRELLAVANDRGRRERHVEVGIANENAALTAAGDFHRTGDETIERRFDIEVDRV